MIWLTVTDITVEGVCPDLPTGVLGTCVEMCSSDAGCDPGLKCCSNGCGHTCQKPGKFFNTTNSLTINFTNEPSVQTVNAVAQSLLKEYYNH